VHDVESTHRPFEAREVPHVAAEAPDGRATERGEPGDGVGRAREPADRQAELLIGERAAPRAERDDIAERLEVRQLPGVQVGPADQGDAQGAERLATGWVWHPHRP
jgi:hypothetical protein